MALLEVKDLQVSFFTPAGEVKAVGGISFSLERGRVLGIVGESGSGKSVTSYAIMQILEGNGKIVSGSIQLDGQELVGAGEKVMKELRGNRISMIFQDPMTSLNPTFGGYFAPYRAEPPTGLGQSSGNADAGWCQ